MGLMKTIFKALLFGPELQYGLIEDEEKLKEEIFIEKIKVKNPTTIIAGPEYYEKIMGHPMALSTNTPPFRLYFFGLEVIESTTKKGFVIVSDPDIPYFG